MTENITGKISYKENTVALIEGERSSLLAIDVPPSGYISANDFVTAHNLLKHVLGFKEGDSISLLGYRSSFGSKDIILISRILS